MEYIQYHEDDVPPPPLDDISSAGGTEGDLEDFDLDINALNSYNGGSSPHKHYKSFQATIKVQPTDLVYREEHSRAAPRKGFEPKAFLTIGETKQEHVEYVGRRNQTVTAASHQHRQTVSASARKQTSQHRQSSTHSAPATHRSKTRFSRVASGRGGRHSVWSSPGYTPLPVAPPPTLPTRENRYIHHPFKQDLSHDALKLDPAAKRPVSPGEEMKQATILATMEVGRFINQREKSPKISKYREPRLLKARLRPLNTVDIDGPTIQDCQGVQADRRKFGPSLVKTRQQQQLDDMIRKNAAIKDITTANYGSRTGSSKVAETRKKCSSSSQNRLKTPESNSSTRREPTPSPYSSTTHIDEIGNDPQTINNEIPSSDKHAAETDAGRNRANTSTPLSATRSEASHTEQQTIARSVSAVTIRHRENTAIQQSEPGSAKAHKERDAVSDTCRRTLFITDAESESGSRVHSAKDSKQQQQQQTNGCKDYREVASSHRKDGDEDDEEVHRGFSGAGGQQYTANASRNNNTSTTNSQQRPTQSTHNGKSAGLHDTSKDDSTLVNDISSKQNNNVNNNGTNNNDDNNNDNNDYIKHKADAAQDCSPANEKSTSLTGQRKQCESTTLPTQPQVPTFSHITWGENTLTHSGLNAKQTPKNSDHDLDSKGLSYGTNKPSSSKLNSREYLEGRSTFITAGFLTLDSMISEARNMLRHSYSLNDLDKSCDWDKPIKSPRSVQTINKGVTFADEERLHYYDPSSESTFKPEDLQLELYNDTKLDLSAVNEGPSEPEVPTRPCQNSMSEVSSLDSLQRELAARDSKYGIHGEISAYLTTKTLTRQIIPPEPKPPKKRVSGHRLRTQSGPADQPPVGVEETTEAELSNPPPTPYLPWEPRDTPRSGSPSFDVESVASDEWEVSEPDGKCFLETIVELMHEVHKQEEEIGADKALQTRSLNQLPEGIEGRVKPVNLRNGRGVVEPIASVPPACFRINALPPHGHLFYFAYDADMNHKRFSTLIGRQIEDKRWALLFGFQLVFNKQGIDKEAGLFANIEANPYTSTEGAVYTISYEELALVDSFHGYPRHYARLILPVWVCNSLQPDQYNIAQYCVPCVTYIAQDAWILTQGEEPPSKEYNLRQVINGSEQLSSNFKEHLATMLQQSA